MSAKVINRPARFQTSDDEGSNPLLAVSRRDAIFDEMRDRHNRDTDRMFGKLLVGQWLFAIVLALAISPWTYVDGVRALHFHVKVAIVFGALINALPLALIWLRPGWWGTRQAIAVVQMLWSAVLIMITGGRIETHFHVFGSLAFLAFYRDWKLLPTATIVVAADHLARGLWWPDSVYGISNPEWWRFLEHAGWVAFEDLVLLFGCVRGVAELRKAAAREARLERTRTIVERTVRERTTALQVSIERYRALVENTAAIPFELDATTHRMLYIAPQATQLLDCLPSDLLDSGYFAAACHPDDAGRVRDAIDAFSRGKRPGNDPIDFRMISKSGRNVWARTLLSNCDGQRIRGITLDVTRQHQLESELRQAQKLESVGRLAAGVAHEINTPIQFVSDSVQFVRDAMTDLITVVDKHQRVVQRVVECAPDDECAREAIAATVAADLPYLADEMPKALDRALDGLDRVAVIVRSMKVFAHNNGTLTGADLNHAIASTLAIARNEYRYVADLETDYAELPPVVCLVGEINQVVLNVLLNAAHAISDVVAEGERGKITVRTRRDGNDVVISIGDTGGGIPERIRERIFDPFFTTKPVGKGTGQGLALARAVVVDKHRGSFNFESTSRGTTFHIRIPIDPNRIALEQAA
jgi:signal transduction histidine kinase